MANEANKDAHYCGRSSGLASTIIFMMSSILISVINLALDHSDSLLRDDVEKFKLASRFVQQLLYIYII